MLPSKNCQGQRHDFLRCWTQKSVANVWSPRPSAGLGFGFVFVDIHDFIKLAIKQRAFGRRFARCVQAVTREGSQGCKSSEPQLKFPG